MKGLFRFLCLYLAAAVLLGVASPIRLHAQQNASAVIGATVLDPVGNAVPNASVVVRNESSSAVSRSTTDQQSKFSVTGLPVGNYTVEVSAPGFAIAIRQGVQASAERAVDLTVALSLGSVSDAITRRDKRLGSLFVQQMRCAIEDILVDKS